MLADIVYITCNDTLTWPVIIAKFIKHCIGHNEAFMFLSFVLRFLLQMEVDHIPFLWMFPETQGSCSPIEQ